MRGAMSDTVSSLAIPRILREPSDLQRSTDIRNSPRRVAASAPATRMKVGFTMNMAKTNPREPGR